MENAIEYQINLLRWDFFATLTFRDEQPTIFRARERRLVDWLATYAHEFAMVPRHIKFEVAQFVWRSELGGIGGRQHFHVLLGGIPRRKRHVSACFALMNRWAKYNGIARVRLYEGSRNAAAYMSKGINGASPDAYEVRRFGGSQADVVHFSAGAVRRLLDLRCKCEIRAEPLRFTSGNSRSAA